VTETVLVLGVGNLLCGDDAFGVRAVEALQARGRLPEHVVLLDGGTQGIYLLPYISEAARLLVFDAVDVGGAPGRLTVMNDAAVPSFVAACRMSAHDGGVPDLLALAELGGWAPRAVALVGAQVATVGLGDEMSAAVAGCVGAAVDQALAILAEWGAA